MNAIDCRGLHKTYEGFALHDLSFSLPSGTILGLVGENGAGKSTTLRLLMNTIGRDAGSVSLLGVDNQSKDFLRVKQDIGIVLDESCLPETLTAREVGKLMALTYERWEPETFSGYLTRFSIPLDKANKDFSRGMKMKLALAVALSHRAKLLLLDEATSGLDPMVREEVLDILLDFTREGAHTVVLSSHIVSDLEKVCDYIAFLHQGKRLLCEERTACWKSTLWSGSPLPSFRSWTPPPSRASGWDLTARKPWSAGRKFRPALSWNTRA